MKQGDLESAGEIEKIIRAHLVSSKAWGVFPTPVDKIVRFADLRVEKNFDLCRIEPGFLPARLGLVKSAISKVVGAIDFQKKTIYLDHSQKTPRKNFIKLHEVGHKACTWQNALGFLDDEKTLSLDVKRQFEREANYFASGALFQLDRFDAEMAKLPLALSSPLILAKKFGGSRHASIRRYVQHSRRRCALLVLHEPHDDGKYQVKISHYFQSDSFSADFGDILWPKRTCGLEFPFVQEIKRKRRFHEDGNIGLKTKAGNTVKFRYHFLNNSFNTFILVMPAGEK